MLTVGNILKKAREQAGIPIEDIAQATKIKQRYLEKIEQNEFGFIGSTFIKGFIRSYSQCLDLDSEALVAIYRRQVGEDEKPIKQNLNKVKTSGFVISPIHIIGAGVALFFASVFIIIIVQFYRLQQPPRLDVVSPQPLVFETDKTSLEIKGATEEQTIVNLNGSQIQLKPDKTFSVTVDLKPGDNTFVVEAYKQYQDTKRSSKTIVAKLTTGSTTTNGTTPPTTAVKEVQFTVQASDSAWLQIISDKVQQGIGVVDKNYARTFKTKDEFTVTTGKPNVTKLTFNGEVKQWTIKNGVGTLTCTRTNDSWSCK